MNLGVVLQFAGRLDEAICELEATIDLNPSFAFARTMLALTYLGKGLPERAVIEAAKARELDSERPDIISMQGHVLARAGYVREALKAIDDLKRLAGERIPSPWAIAFVSHRPRRPRSRLRVARQSRRRALLGAARDRAHAAVVVTEPEVPRGSSFRRVAQAYRPAGVSLPRATAEPLGNGVHGRAMTSRIVTGRSLYRGSTRSIHRPVPFPP